MHNELLLGEEIIQLEKEKGDICITIILPTHRLSPERRTDRANLNRAVDQAADLLRYQYDAEETTRPLLQKLKSLAAEIDLLHNEDGIGLFISSGTRLLVRFPFPVEGKVFVGNSFHLRDLLYKTQLSAPYFVLVVSQNSIQFLEGRLNKLLDLKDPFIPRYDEHEYIYEKPSQSSSYAGYAHVKSFEKDKSVTEEIRIKSFFKKLDQSVHRYIQQQPLVLLAPEKEAGWYLSLTKQDLSNIMHINGNYTHSTNQELAELVWPMIYRHQLQRFVEEVKKTSELVGQHRAVFGIESCWRAANAGNAYKLLVEKDFHCPGFVGKQNSHLYLKPPSSEHRTIPDIINELVELVRSKNGTILFGENGSLSSFGRIALQTRY